MKRLTLIWLLAIIGLSACNKNKQDENVPEKLRPHLSTTLIGRSQNFSLDPNNKANPYDSVGLLHNIILDSLRKYVLQFDDTSRGGKTAYLNSFLKRTRVIDFRPSYYPELEQKICTDYKSVLLNGSFTAQTKATLERMVDILQNVESTNEFESYARKIKTIEKEIVEGNLEAKEKKYLLTVSSVLRHSGYYWMEQFENENVTQKIEIFGFLRKIGGLIAGIGADATTAGWHYLKNSPYDVLVGDSAWMSEICGYYTGWW